MKIVLETGFCLKDSWWLETFRCGVITDKHNQLRVVGGYIRGRFLLWSGRLIKRVCVVVCFLKMKNTIKRGLPFANMDNSAF